MTALRVLYLNPFSQEVSGPDESLRTLLAELVRRGVEPHVVLPRPGPQVPRYEALGAKVHYAPLTILRRRPGLLEVLLLPFRLARGVLAIARLARRERIDVIHTNMEVVLDGGLAAALLGLRHVQHYRGNTLDRPKLVFDVLTRYWCAVSARVFCISRSTAQIFVSRGLGAKVEPLYNPVDVDRYAGAPRLDAVRAGLGAGPGQLLVATVGRIHPRKDVETFLRAGALLAAGDPRVRLAVVGAAEVPEEHAYERDMRRLAVELGVADRLVWAGARRDMPEVMKALDLLVLTSRHEGFGRVLAEALAARTPVVATDEGAYPELLEGLEGTALAPPERPLAYAAEAAGLMRSGVRPGPRAAERFRKEAVARLALAVYGKESV